MEISLFEVDSPSFLHLSFLLHAMGVRTQRVCAQEGQPLLWLLSAEGSHYLAVGVLIAHGNPGEMVFWGEGAPAVQLGKHLSHCPASPGLQAGSSPCLTSSGHGRLSM